MVDTEKHGGRNPLVDRAASIDIFGVKSPEEQELDRIRGPMVAARVEDDPRFGKVAADPEAGVEAGNGAGSYEAFSMMFGGPPPMPGRELVHKQRSDFGRTGGGMGYTPLVPFTEQPGPLAAVTRSAARHQVVLGFMTALGQRDDVVNGVRGAGAVDARARGQNLFVHLQRDGAGDLCGALAGAPSVLALPATEPVPAGGAVLPVPLERALPVLRLVSRIVLVNPRVNLAVLGQLPAPVGRVLAPSLARCVVEILVVLRAFCRRAIAALSVDGLELRVFAALPLVFRKARLARGLLAVLGPGVLPELVQRSQLLALGASLHSGNVTTLGGVDLEL